MLNQPITVTINVYSLGISDGAADITGQTQETVVGLGVSLSAVLRGPGGPPANWQLQNFQWTIPGDTVKSYEMAIDHAESQELTASDLAEDWVHFYWVDELTSGQVSVTATIAGVGTASASTTYNVLRPTMDSFTSQTTNDVPAIDVSDPGFLSGGKYLHFGSFTGSLGIKWTAEVTTPAGGAGKIAFTQLVKTLRTRTLDNASSTEQKFSSDGKYILDDGLGIQYGATLGVGTTVIGAGDTETHTLSDTPGTPLPGRKETSVNDQFENYLMYKPDGNDSIWVTLGKLEWNWKGAATKNAGVWSIDTGSADYSTNPDPSGVDSTHLPTWDGKATALGWH